MVFELHLDSDSVRLARPEKPLFVKPTDSLRLAVERMMRSDQGCVLVRREDQLLGIFTERDALKLMADQWDLEAPIENFMVRNLATVRENDTVQDAISKMSAGGYRRLPVVDARERPVGLLKVANILHYLVEHIPSAIYNLPPAPRRVMQEREGA